MATSCSLPVTPDLATLRAKLQGLLRFLGKALSISNAHTVDFYTESVWEKLVDLSPETVLEVLKRSTREAEARPSDARPLVEAEEESGEWRVGGAAWETEVVRSLHACPVAETEPYWASRGAGPRG